MADKVCDQGRTNRTALLGGGVATALALGGCVSDFGKALLDPDDCTTVQVAASDNPTLNLSGIEDLAADLSADGGRDPVVFLSATDRRPWLYPNANGEKPDCLIAGTESDGIFAVRLSDIRAAIEDNTGITAQRVLSGTLDRADIHPHGISILSSPSGKATKLFIVNHPTKCVENKAEHETSVIAGDITYASAGVIFSSTMTLGPGTQPSIFCSANDIVGLKRNEFFLTHDRGGCPPFSHELDMLLSRAQQYLLYYDGTQFHRVAEDFVYINGLVLSPDAKELYVADTRGSDVRIFDVATLTDTKTPRPEPTYRQIRIGKGVDNLDWGHVKGASGAWENDGSIYTGAHPDILRFIFHGLAEDEKTAPASPTAIVQINPDPNAEQNYRLLAEDDGKKFSAASATLRLHDLVISGGVFADGLFVCRTSTEKLTVLGAGP